MSSTISALIIIPAYNEAECILTTARAVEAAGYDYVIVNDGSHDETLEICKENGLNVVDLPLNLGIGGAVQTGHKYAQRYGYSIDVQIDGDGQHDPKYLPSLIKAIESGADLVIGSRFLNHSTGFRSTFFRRIGIGWLSKWIKVLTGKIITDPTSGFRACGERAIDLFCESYPVDYPEPDSIATALRKGLNVQEIPVEMRERQGGVSSIGGFSGVYYMVKVTLAIWIACMNRYVQ
ncbi:glycosyl transferase family 2 [Coriobacterium glomerans PW2]|uniref:Glycosyl transferase family 2 n=1 Tax=Coriobacterium glomerans (strain ATCC 49209 / DSM 20642 / JCM 10262 / PW2) TaxID=700015 RepID=F2N851_CORGP|nr:glycosyltransferase family 2 protein [Coriobacterium glomerans]AEB07234.1 glycosyl transferase family 2 [Coriobacterium glomerans PW2]